MPPPHFWHKIPVLVLLLVSTGCDQWFDRNRVCESGIIDGLSLFLGAAASTFVFALILTGLFYFFQYRKIKSWDIASSVASPGFSNAWLSPVVFIVLLICLIALVPLARCSSAQEMSHIGGILVGWFVGWATTALVFHMMTRRDYT